MHFCFAELTILLLHIVLELGVSFKYVGQIND